MSLRSLKLVVSLALPLAGAWALSGCGAARSRGGSSGRSAYRGTVTFANRSSSPVCHVEATPAERSTQIHVDQRIEPGQSATFEAPTGVSQLWISDCDGGLVFGGPPVRGGPPPNLQGSLAHATVALHDAGAAPSADDHLAIAASPVSFDDWRAGAIRALVRNPALSDTDASLSEQGMSALREAASSRNYVETFAAFEVVQSDWAITRHRATGTVTGRSITGMSYARFPDGHCQVVPVVLAQAHDGSDFTERVAFGGLGPNLGVPCAFVEHMASRPGVAH